MPFATHDGNKIHYKTYGTGAPLIIQHGLYSNAEELAYPQFVEAVGQTFQMIFIDSLGHGASDAPSDYDHYRPAHRARDIAAVLDDLGIEKAHYFGYSMGGWLGCAMAAHAPERLKSICIAGFPVDIHPPSDMSDEQFEEVWANSKRGLFFDNKRAFARLNSETEPGLKMCLRAILDHPEHKEAVAALTVPVMMLCGEDDDLFAGAQAMAGELGIHFLPVPGNHGEAINQNLGFYFPDVAEFFLKVE
ncbi:MAG: alpha/beta fold hydrolase [Alphaproteobacteria bacterium]|nr:MAG: alpha/beta fold hydrolase [Alphaproteobacteria bacterium]